MSDATHSITRHIKQTGVRVYIYKEETGETSPVALHDAVGATRSSSLFYSIFDDHCQGQGRRNF